MKLKIKINYYILGIIPVYFLLSINPIIGLLGMILLITFGGYKSVEFQVINLIFQNFFIGLFSPNIDLILHFKFLHILNYLIPVFSVLIFIFNEKKSIILSEYTNWKSIITILFLLILFLILGLLFYKSISSLIYFRLFSLPFIFYYLGLFLAKKNNTNVISQFNNILFFSISILAISAIVGRFSSYFMSLVNDDFYFSLKYERPLTVSEIREAYRSKFLNWNFFNLTTFRYGSLLKNIISYSYVMMISITYGLVLKIKKIQYFLIVFVIVLLISFSKGAIIFSILTVFIVVFNRNVLKKNRVSIVETIILLIPFWLLVITVGYFSNNEHIIGFVSGFHRMMDNPFGNGLGFSGNLSPVRKLSVFGEELPFRGYWTRFYNGSESIIGVLFSSLGFFGFIYLGVLFTLIAKSKENLLKSENFILLFPLIMVFQGIFQEEAFSPYALGFTMFILGLYNGKNIRLNY